MSFFTSRPKPPIEEPVAQPVEPEWFGPPRGVLPGYAPERAVVFRTDDAILVAGRFDVFPSGAEFTLELQLRVDDEDLMEMPWERHRRRPRVGTELPDDFLRLGILFADGSSWTNLDNGFPQFDERPSGPVVMSRGGGGGGGRWSMDQWMWPLPPDGPLTFIAEWPKYGVAESRGSVDAGALRDAAKEAQVLWS